MNVGDIIEETLEREDQVIVISKDDVILEMKKACAKNSASYNRMCTRVLERCIQEGTDWKDSVCLELEEALDIEDPAYLIIK